MALELSASHDHNLNGAFSNFNVDITLTKKGLENYERVVEAVFEYAQIVKNRGVQEYVFDETKRVGEIQFDFMDKTSPVGYTIKLAGKMQDFDTPEKIQDIIKHIYVVETLDKDRT